MDTENTEITRRYPLDAYLANSWLPAFRHHEKDALSPTPRARPWPSYPELQTKVGTRRLVNVSRIDQWSFADMANDCEYPPYFVLPFLLLRSSYTLLTYHLFYQKTFKPTLNALTFLTHPPLPRRSLPGSAYQAKISLHMMIPIWSSFLVSITKRICSQLCGIISLAQCQKLYGSWRGFPSIMF